MIHRLFSPDLESFKEFTFGPGLNVIVADRTPEATERMTRNSAGKSSIIDAIHFVLGGDVRDTVLSAEALRPFTFGLVFDLAGARTTAERSPSKSTRVYVSGGNREAWPRKPEKEIEGDAFRTSEWKLVLGSLYFGLAPTEDAGEPTFRALFPYFARRVRDGGFTDPRLTFAKQSEGEWHVGLSYLLGLDWTIPKRVNILRGKESELKSLRKKSGVLKDVFGDPRELRSRHVIVADHARALRSALADFKVLPEYHELEAEASKLSRMLQSLTGDDALDVRTLAGVRAASEREEALTPDYTRIEEMYAELGVVLPESVAKRYEDVRAFHDSVIRNRRVHLKNEITRLEKAMSDRLTEMRKVEERQAQIMRTLKTHGALDQYTQLQSELSRIEAEALALEERLANVERMQTLKAELEIERNQLFLRLQQDLAEQRAEIDRATLTFAELVTSLSDKQGAFDVRASPNGPEFIVKVQGDKGMGVKNMEIFAFDMMLMRLLTEREKGPRFLVHDSHLFDGVDGRQVASALRIGAEWAARFGFQYIVTLNSDDLRRLEESTFDANPYVLKKRLDDRTETGGLFGFRFE